MLTTGRIHRATLVWLVLIMACFGAVSGSVSGSVSAQKMPPAGKPNFVFILTDDQSLDTLPYMPNVRELRASGTTFENFVMPTATCCPSRAAFLRGQYLHNTGMHGWSGGDAQAFANRGLDGSTVATWLDREGYRTGLFGKYLNGYGEYEYVPPGWDRWMANANRAVWADCFAEDGRKRCYGGHPDALLAQKAEEFVRSNGDDPFFLYLALGAPHQDRGGLPAHARADQDRFRRAPLPRPPSFNEADVSDKPPWMRGPRLNGGQIRRMEEEHRGRLRSLQTVDRTVARFTQALSETGELDNTYIIYATDNGYHLGAHRLPAGKHMPYAEDHVFPMVVSGPGVPEGETRQEFVSGVDFAPTLADLSGAETPPFVDGRSAVPLLREEDPPWRDAALFESTKPSPLNRRPAYAGVWTADGAWYTEHATGERELYDLGADPYQLENLAGSPAHAAREARLSARLDALRDCEAETCRVAEDAR